MMMTTFAGRLAAMLAAVLGLAGTFAQAADIKVLSTIAFQRVFETELPGFNRSSGHTVSAEFGGTTAMATRVRNGEVADVYFGTRQAIDALLAAGKVQPDSVVDLARSPVGMAVRKGAPRPDISTADALRRAMLAAKGITYPDPAAGSPSANHLVKVAGQLGIGDELKARTRRPPGGGAAGPTMLLTGEAELAVQQNCELLLEPGVELLGPLPPEFQLITIMSAAVPVTAREPAAGRAFIRSLQTPAAAEVMQRWGLEPIGRNPAAQAAEIKVLSTIAFERVFESRLPAFNRAGSDIAKAEFGTATAMANRVLKDEPADLYVGPRQNVDALVKAGKVRPDSVVDLARSSVGMAVRKGAPRPDISTAAALKRALLAARGITYPDPAFGSPSGLHLTKVAAQLGISDELKARTRRPPDGTAFGPTLLISGEADLALQQTSELLMQESAIDLLGPLPPEFQLITIMSVAVPVNAREPAAARAFIRSLQTPAAGEAMKRWGLEPIGTASAPGAQTADVKVLSTIAFQGAFGTALPEFNRTSAHRVHAEFGGAGVMLERVQKDEIADLYFGPRETVDALVAAGKVRPDSVVDVVRSPMGMAVRKGAPKPDISTADGLRRAILAARGITYPDPKGVSPSAKQLVKIAAWLGISEELKARTRRPPRGTAAGPLMLTTGEVDLAVQQNCELMMFAPAIELLGPLPPEFQLSTIMSAAVPVTAREPAAAQDFLRYLQTPAAAELMRRWALEPVARAAAGRAPAR